MITPYPRPPQTACQACHHGPAQPIVIRRHVGYIVRQKFIRIEPTLCRDCAIKTIKRYTWLTLLQGWWGLYSLFIGNPYTLAMNAAAVFKARRIPPAEYTLRPRGLRDPAA